MRIDRSKRSEVFDLVMLLYYIIRSVFERFTVNPSARRRVEVYPSKSPARRYIDV